MNYDMVIDITLMYHSDILVDLEAISAVEMLNGFVKVSVIQRRWMMQPL
jgi:hypothetical protein